MSGRLLFHTAVYNLADVCITLVCDDAFRIVVQLFFAVFDMCLQMRHQTAAEVQLRSHFFIALKKLDSVPAQVLRIHFVGDGFFDVGNGMLHTSRKHMGLLIGRAARGDGDGFFRNRHTALALQGARFHHRASKLCAQLREVDFVSVFAHDINHIHRDDHRDTQLQQLCGKVKIALHVGAVQNVDDRIRFFFHQKSASDHFLQSIGAEGINAGQILDDDILMPFQPAFLFFHGNARPVANVLI